MDAPFEQTPLQKQEETLVKVLHPKRRAFVREYCKDQNATKACIRAGYSKNAAEAIGSELLGIPEVRAAVDQELEEMATRAGITKEFILQEMTVLATANLDDFVIDEYGNVQPAEGHSRSVMKALQSIKKTTTIAKDGSKSYHAEIRLWGKTEPLKLMGRHVGIFADRLEHTGKDGKPIETVTRIERVVVKPPQGT
jgi:phage terminase small subunit